MAQLYTNNFESGTVGNPVTGLVNGGTPPGNAFAYTATTPIHGAQSISAAQATGTNSVAVYTGISAVANMDVVASFRIIAVGGGQSTGAVDVRTNTGETVGYLFYQDCSSGASSLFQILNIGSSFAQIGTTITQTAAFGRALVAGDVVWIRAQCIGTTLQGKIWLDGTAEPSSFQISATDSTTSAAGFAGLHVADSGNHTFLFDDFTINDFSSLNSGVPTAFSIGSTIATVQSPGGSGGTGPYTYQWYRSTTPGFTPGGGNIVSGATALVLNDTGLTNSTTYYYKLVTTDSTTATVTSPQLTLTTGTSINVLPNATGMTYYGRWNVTSGAATTMSNGSLCEFVYTGNSCVLNFDTSSVINGFYPVIEYWVDEVGPTRATLDSTGLLTITPTYNTLPSGAPPYSTVTAAQHRVRFTAAIDSLYLETGNNWTSRTQGLIFLGLTLANSQTVLAQPTNPNTIEFLGDSITAGLRVLYEASSPVPSNQVDSAALSWPIQTAEMVGLKPIVNGHGGQGITQGSTDGAPAANAAFPFTYSGVSWNPSNKPIVVWVYQGTNDSGNAGFTQSQYQTFLSTIRTAYPNAVIFASVPYNTGGAIWATIKASIQAAVTALNDPRIFYNDFTSVIASTDTSDGTHPSIGGCVKMAAAFASVIQNQLNTLGIKMQSTSGTGYGASLLM